MIGTSSSVLKPTIILNVASSISSIWHRFPNQLTAGGLAFTPRFSLLWVDSADRESARMLRFRLIQESALFDSETATSFELASFYTTIHMGSQL